MALIIAWRLAIVEITIQPLVVTSCYAKGALLRTMSEKVTKAQNEISKVAAEAVSNIRTITYFSSQDRILKMLEKAEEGPKQESIRQSWITGIWYGTSQCLVPCIWAFDFWYGGKLMSEGVLRVKSIFMTFLTIPSTRRVIGNVASMTSVFSRGFNTVRSILVVLDRQTRLDPENQEGYKPNRIAGHIEYLSIVDFAYPMRPNVMIFKGFSLGIEARKSTALLGASGSGKSTIINLIERFYGPLKGMIKIDGRDLSSYHLRTLRKHIALVSQEPILFAGTIRGNITYGSFDQTKESEIIEAAKTTNVHDFIVGLKDGYDTWCGDRGLQLSGGQKQRIAIA